MKRTIVYTLLAMTLGMIGAVWAAGSWLLESPDGIRWLLKELSSRNPVKVEVRAITGGIGETLRMEGVTVRWPNGKAELKELRLRCRPLWLPFGHLAVQELFLRGVRIQDDQPDSGAPPDLTWPRLAASPRWLDAWVDRLQVDDLEYRRLATPPVIITTITALLDWRRDLLSVTNLAVTTPEGRAAGRVTAGFVRPTLTATLSLSPLRPLSGFSRFDLCARLLPGRAPEQLAGKLSLTALQGGKSSLELSGDMGMTQNAFNVRGAELLRSGRRGTVRGEGSVLLTTGEPRVRLRLRMASVDLAKESGVATDLSGLLSVEGSVSRYTGRFDLNNRGGGWRRARLLGSFSGDGSGVRLKGVTGLLLGGTVLGDLRLGWSDGFAVTAALRGKGLDPAIVTPDWNGVVNLDLRGSARWSGQKPVRASVTGRLHESHLRGQALSGEIEAQTAAGDLLIQRLLLKGNGFDLHAKGDLSRRLTVAATITDLSALVPHSGGSLELQGWVRHSDHRSSGVLTGHGRELTGEGVRIATAELAARMDGATDSSVEVTADLKGVTSGHLQSDSASLRVRGTVERHLLALSLRSGGARIDVAASGGYGREGWQGEIRDLSGSDRFGVWKLAAPARLAVSPQAVNLSPLVITGGQAGRLELGSRISLDPLRGSLQAKWRDLDLSRADQWLTQLQLSGRSSGDLRLESPTGERLNLAAQLSAEGTVTLPHRTVTVRHVSLELTADEGGISSAMELGTAEGVRVRGRFISSVPARLGIPEQGELNASWEGVDFSLLRGELPEGAELSGTVSGTIEGRLLPGERLELKGKTVLAGGAASWRGEGKELSARVKQGDISWNWQGESLSGAASLVLAEHGEATASFTFPLPARLGSSFDQEGALSGTVKGRFHEKGLLISLFPGLLQESRGELEVDLRAEGLLKEPCLTGKLELSKAGAYLPSAGITLKELQLVARLEREQLTVERFQVASGAGSLSGNAVVKFGGNRMTGYRGSIRGEKFQVVHLPELQLLVSPELTFDGTVDNLALRGVIKIPELLATGGDRASVIQPSGDVIVERGAGAPVRPSPLKLDIQVKAALGERVFVKMEGLDAKLEGGIDLVIRGRESMKGSGEIKVAKGRYSAYGVTLEIKRGRALFAGGAVERPTLDIQALREIGEVKAGVTVSGTPQAPVVKLFSDPAMADVEILSYVVLGRGLNASEDKSSLLMNAASLLSSTGQSVYLQEQIKQRLGIDTFEVTTAKAQGSDYKKIEPSLLDQSGKTSVSSINDSVLQVGKFLTPQLYVSYGWSLLSQSHVFLIRYHLTKQWEVETRASTEATGGDLFYRIEFD